MILSLAVATIGLMTPQFSQANRASNKMAVMHNQEVKYQEIKTYTF